MACGGAYDQIMHFVSRWSAGGSSKGRSCPVPPMSARRVAQSPHRGSSLVAPITGDPTIAIQAAVTVAKSLT